MVWLLAILATSAHAHVGEDAVTTLDTAVQVLVDRADRRPTDPATIYQQDCLRAVALAAVDLRKRAHHADLEMELARRQGDIGEARKHLETIGAAVYWTGELMDYSEDVCPAAFSAIHGLHRARPRIPEAAWGCGFHPDYELTFADSERLDPVEIFDSFELDLTLVPYPLPTCQIIRPASREIRPVPPTDEHRVVEALLRIQTQSARVVALDARLERAGDEADCVHWWLWDELSIYRRIKEISADMILHWPEGRDAALRDADSIIAIVRSGAPASEVCR